MADEEARGRRSDARRRRRDDTAGREDDAVAEAPPDEQESAPDGSAASTSGADSASLIRTGAKVALVGAVIGGVVAAARAWRSHDDVDEQGGGKDEDKAGGRQPRQERDESSEAASRRQPQPDDGEASAARPRRQERDVSAPGSRRGGEKSARPEAVRAETENAKGRGESDDEQAEPHDDDHPAARLARRAIDQVAELTGRTPDGVLGLKKMDTGWNVTVAVVEVPRIPSTTDVLASYDVELDEDGDVRAYRQIRRYVRSQPENGGGE
jgi:Gas vesicle synthesis protein GvpO